MQRRSTSSFLELANKIFSTGSTSSHHHLINKHQIPSSFLLRRRMGYLKRTRSDQSIELTSTASIGGHRSKLPRFKMVNNNHQLTLNEAESKLCELLHRCTNHLKSSDQRDQDLSSLELRIAGGWVRDKLLGVESNDLDIAISCLTGQEFAKLFSSFIQDNLKHFNSNPSEHDQEQPIKIGKIATIEARPDQSKHLETATTTFLGLDLDFVQLRSEEYGDQDSRIPSAVKFGTPLEDALRRDITINSLFFNVHNSAIEDHTGKGLPDLESGLVRTPLPAEQTFKDDPLRLLRCIRFSTRFGFQLDPDIILAAKSEPIRIALKEKISRERVGTEIDKMLKGRDPLASLQMIQELGLYALTFSPPTSLETISIEPLLATKAASWLDRLADNSDQQELPSLHPELLGLFSCSSAIRRRLFLACALLPYRYLKAKAGKKEVWSGEVVLSESLKLGNHDKNFISHLFRSLEYLNIKNLKSILSSSSARLPLGGLLRNQHVHDLKQVEADASLAWQSTFLFALVVELSELEPENNGGAVDCIDTFNQTVEKILELDLPLVLTPAFEKSRLDGKEICQVLKIKPGKHLAQIIEKVINRQIEYPAQTKEEAVGWLEAQVQSGQINV